MEWEPFTIRTDDLTVRLSPDGLDVNSGGIHLFFLGWDEIDRIRWRPSGNMKFTGVGREIVIPESALSEDELERIKTRLVDFDPMVNRPLVMANSLVIGLFSPNLLFILVTVVVGAPFRHTLLGVIALLFLAYLFSRLRDYGKTCCFRRRIIKVRK